MLYREFKNSEMLSMIGFGGILVARETQEEANNYVAEAITMGINYFDIAPTYGISQERTGPALRGKRNDIFLACKTTQRTAKGAEYELHDSLKKLETDRFDLYQLHGLNSPDEAHTILGPGGALETFIKAKEKGLIRYLGFSAHSEEAAIILMEQYNFDSALFPVNWICQFTDGFGNRIMETAIEKGVARLALKAMAHTVRTEDYKAYPKAWYRPVEEKELAQLTLRYTLSQPVTAALTPGHMEYLRWAVEIGNDFKSVTSDEIQYLKKLSENVQPIFHR